MKRFFVTVILAFVCLVQNISFGQSPADIEKAYESRIGKWSGQAELIGLGSDLAEAHYSWTYGRQVVSASYRVLSYLELYNEHMILTSWNAKDKNVSVTNFSVQGRLDEGVSSFDKGVITTSYKTPGPNGELKIVDELKGDNLVITGFGKDGKTAIWKYTFKRVKEK